MRQSMTGFAAAQGEHAGHAWTWELRGVNGKGLDLRLRLPDGIDGLEAEIRARTAKALKRGNVQITLKLSAQTDESAAHLDEAYLAAVLDAMARIEQSALDRGLSLAPANAADIVALRGMMSAEPARPDDAALRDALLADYDRALASFVDMRKSEGARLAHLLHAQIDSVEALVSEAVTLAEARATAQPARLRAQLDKILNASDGVDDQRLAQELALIAVKADITEELDRLRAHIAAARDLLRAAGAVGRKFEFLTQEFNREANTLCSKAADPALTRVGLALKTVIDQMREQVANVE
ncbi:YicC/YloC family endoribonuclease [Cognatishimia sp. F0-27]|uniref:YicC/YloC family endoribonuclease n=1 Tax=Cognatishimia sp. F0-27 TaxID=2816855 RepID=UPI001D0C1937|nr:YicC/YloC family endoribonuclease [Cognatishimia sp. F0-27]MCC1492669.1 YicC family protein [Cognatishimia sp. F0-27]